MIPFVATQIQAIIEDIRLLEAFVPVPLGLYSDIRMLRESLPYPEAAELSRDETRERRLAYVDLSETRNALALDTISSMTALLDILEQVRSGEEPPLKPEWISRARRVLARTRQRVGGDMRAGTAARIGGLYVIVDPEATRGRSVIDVARATLRGGTRVLQLRDKLNDRAEALSVARQLKSLCEEYGALFVVNDDAALAFASDAHGLHVGQTDLPVAEARRILMPGQVVGRSNSTVEQATESQAQGVDYIAVGAVYATSTMGKTEKPAVGVDRVSKVKRQVSQPVVAIGGISLDNIAEVVRAGADCICVVSAVTLADDPETSTRRLLEAIQNAK